MSELILIYKGSSHDYDLKASDTIRDLKIKIRQDFGIPIKDQKLHIGATLLNNDDIRLSKCIVAGAYELHLKANEKEVRY